MVFRKVWWVLPGLLATGGLYLMLLAFAPSLNVPFFGLTQPDVRAILQSTTPEAQRDWLYIPQINLSMPIQAGGPDVLLHNIWHRVPENGDPVKGGNFVLSGHRFYMGLTPGETVARSPLYRMDELAVGDTFFVDFGGRRFTYRIHRVYEVPSNAADIESFSDTPKLTLYSCDLRGAAAGRYVVEALPE